MNNVAEGATSESSPLTPSPSQAGLGSLDQARTFKLAQGAQDVQLQAAGGRREVQPFFEAHKRYAALVQLLHRRDDVLLGLSLWMFKMARDSADVLASVRERLVNGYASPGDADENPGPLNQ